MIQVTPINDLMEHEQEGTMCHCEPEVDWSHAEAIVMHNALDGREDSLLATDWQGSWSVERENQHK